MYIETQLSQEISIYLEDDMMWVHGNTSALTSKEVFTCWRRHSVLVTFQSEKFEIDSTQLTTMKT